MGLLDEAIRQHLELKRRRGADPGEVARQEDEALGPVTGAGAPAAPAHDEPVVEVPFEPAEPEPEPEPEPIVDEPPVPYEPPAASAPPAEPAPPPVAGDPEFDLQSPTVEFSVDDEVEEEPPPPEPEPELEEPEAEPADELEETPEFLQETPEHDRLWFEQKPPRDFDF